MQTIDYALSRATSLFPENIAIIENGRKRTYRQLADDIDVLTSFLASVGLDKVTSAAILAPNCSAYLETYFACAKLGSPLAPLNFRLRPEDLALILEHAEARVLIFHADFKSLVIDLLNDESKSLLSLEHLLIIEPTGYGYLRLDAMSLPALKSGEIQFKPLAELDNSFDACNSQRNVSRVQAEDLAHLYYTSGTTGKPKGVMLSHHNVLTHAYLTVAELRLSDRDVWLHAAPMFHLADAWATFAITLVGGCHAFLPYFRPSEALSLLETARVTVTNLIPTMLNAMLNEPSIDNCDFSSLRLLLSGGAPIAPDTVRRLIAAFGCEYVQTYGMTETSPYLTLGILSYELSRLDEKEQLAIKSRTGRPMLGVELKVVRADGSEVKADDMEVGEIIVRGPTVSKGYWKSPEETQSAFKDNWLYTGDLAVVDCRGYINIVDRSKDMIKSGGENVYSTEVEHVLYEYPKILECAVIGIPNQDWGEAVHAEVVLKSDVVCLENEIIDFAKQKLAGFKVPKSVRFVPELPRTGSGKISKKLIRDNYWQGYDLKVH